MPLLIPGQERKRGRYWPTAMLAVLLGPLLLFAVLVVAAATIPLQGGFLLLDIGGKGKVVLTGGDIDPGNAAEQFIPQGLHYGSPGGLPWKVWSLRIGKRVYYIIPKRLW